MHGQHASRVRHLVTAALVLGMAMPAMAATTAGHGSPSCTLTIGDPADDVSAVVGVSGQPDQAAPAKYPNVDLTSVSISRRASGMVVTFTVSGLTMQLPTGGEPAPTLAPAGSWRLFFTARGHTYRVDASAGHFGVSRDKAALRNVSGTVDTAANRITVTAAGFDPGAVVTAISGEGRERTFNSPDATYGYDDSTASVKKAKLGRCG